MSTTPPAGEPAPGGEAALTEWREGSMRWRLLTNGKTQYTTDDADRWADSTAELGRVGKHLATQLSAAQAALEKVEARSRVDERTAQLNAHRACISDEHDPANGKIHGYCVVCGVPWPCAVAVDAASVFAQRDALRASLAAAEQARDALIDGVRAALVHLNDALSETGIDDAVSDLVDALKASGVLAGVAR